MPGCGPGAPWGGPPMPGCWAGPPGWLKNAGFTWGAGAPCGPPGPGAGEGHVADLAAGNHRAWVDDASRDLPDP